MKCAHCGRTDGPLFRQNEKGVPGIWACEACNQKPTDPAVALVVATVQQTDKPTLH